MPGIKIMSSVAALAAYAQAQQVLVVATQASCTASKGSWVATTSKCTAQTDAQWIAEYECDGTWTVDATGATWSCVAETAAQKSERECTEAFGTWKIVSPATTKSCVAEPVEAKSERVCKAAGGSWAAKVAGAEAGVCTALTAAEITTKTTACVAPKTFNTETNACDNETANARYVRQWTCGMEFGTWNNSTGVCTAETAAAKVTREFNDAELASETACITAFGTWAAGTKPTAGVCTAETADAKAKRECFDAFGTWINGTKTCTAETADAKAQRECGDAFGTWVSGTKTCTAETAAAKATREWTDKQDALEVECALDSSCLSTWAAGTFPADGVCTAETTAAKTTRVEGEIVACLKGHTDTNTWKSATETCQEDRSHQEAMCSTLGGYPTGYFKADEEEGNWCLDYTTEASLACEFGCSDWGECVTDATVCEQYADEAGAGSSAGLIIGVLFGVLGAVAVGIVLYCFCCKKSDDDFQKA